MSEKNIRKCPVCGSPSTKQDAYNWKCKNNHIWRICLFHKKPVITSLIGELYPYKISGCSCNLDVMNRPEAMNNFSCEKKKDDIIETVKKETCNDCNKKQKNKIKNKVKNCNNITINIITPEGTKTFTEVERDNNSPIMLAPRQAQMAEEEKAKQEISNKIKQLIQDRFGVILSAASKRKVKPKSPSVDSPIKNISEAGKKLWPQFVEKYSYQWENRSNIEDQWAIAAAIWRNYAVKRNVAPFNTNTTDDNNSSNAETTNDYMKNRIVSANNKANNISDTFIRAIEGKFAKKILKQTLESVEAVRNGFYRVVTSRKIKTDYTLKDSGFRNWLKTKKFIPKNGKFIREINGLCNLVIEANEDSNIFLKTEYKFPAQLLALAINIPQDDLKNNKPLVVKQLSKFFRKLMKGDVS